MKERFYERDHDMLSFEEFYQMSEQFFPYKALPVLFRDILYWLLGYFYAVSDNSEETLNFYQQMIKEHEGYLKLKQQTQLYLERGLNPKYIDIAEFIFHDRQIGRSQVSRSQGGRSQTGKN